MKLVLLTHLIINVSIKNYFIFLDEINSKLWESNFKSSIKSEEDNKNLNFQSIDKFLEMNSITPKLQNKITPLNQKDLILEKSNLKKNSKKIHKKNRKKAKTKRKPGKSKARNEQTRTSKQRNPA